MLPYGEGMHLDGRSRPPNRTGLYWTQPALAGEVIDTQFMSKMMGADDQVRLVWYNPAKLLSQEIICFDAALIPLMIIHIAPYSHSYITAGSPDHRHSLTHPAHEKRDVVKNLHVFPSSGGNLINPAPVISTSQVKELHGSRMSQEQQWHAT